MPLVAITREMGSLGKAVANGVAAALALPVIHHEIIDVLADKLRLRKSHVIRLLEGRASLFEKLTADQTSLSIYTAAETFALATRGAGAVFLSWGAANLLAPVPHAVRVRVCAPLEVRVARMKQRIGTEDEEYVRHEIHISDEAHGAIIRRHFGADWRDPELYDLVVNSARIDIGTCVDQILALARHPVFEETTASRARLENLSLEAHVRGALRQHPETARLRLSIAADHGRIILSGASVTARDGCEAERIAAAVAGVVQVESKLQSALGTRSDHKRLIMDKQ